MAISTDISHQPTLAGVLLPQELPTAIRWGVLMVLGSAILAICAQITVPLWPVPMTMQTFGVLVLGMAYGARLGAATVALYLLEGAIGLPVFAGFGGGPAVLFGVTGGYLFGFVIAAAVVGWLAERGWDRNIGTTGVAMLLGTVALYIPGLIWLGSFIGPQQAIAGGLAPFVIGDALKLVLAALLLPATWRLLKRL